MSNIGCGEEKRIGALFADPFISTHTAPENDNNAMDQVVSMYKALAGKLGVAINIAHHTRKASGDAEAHAGDAEAGRGASAIKDAARAVVTIVRMAKKTAKQIGIPDECCGDYIRMDVGKCLTSAPMGPNRVIYLESVLGSS